MVGTGRAAELGVLFRKGDALQTLSDVAVVAFDKTGTLTEGKPSLTSVELSDADLARAAAVEAFSEHPIARAVIAGAAARGLTQMAATEFQSVTGEGARATVEGQRVFVGSARFMTNAGFDVSTHRKVAMEIADRGETPIHVAVGDRVSGVLGVSDPVKPASADAIAKLRSAGLSIALVTGDNTRTADAIARKLGIEIVVAEVLPGGKVEAIEALRAEGGKLAFVGDGINDAPALAAADVGIAMGSGTDVAIEAADVVLMSGDPGGVVRALSVSRDTMRNIRQNLFWAFAYNAALIPVAAGVLYPVIGVLLSPMLAAGAMAVSSVFVITNALRLRRAGQGA
jgi:heavy metal translocating P-type ATPase